jgi:Flp pilus assembly protein TadG
VRETTTGRSRERRREGGSLTIEFALVVPVLAALVFGMIDAGRFIATRTMMAQAAAAGARASCLGTATQTTVDQAVSAAAPGLPSISVDWTNSNCVGTCGWARTAGDRVNLRVQYYFHTVFFSRFRKMMANDSRIVC